MLQIKGVYGEPYWVNDPGDGVVGGALRTGEPYEAKLLYHIYRRRFTGTAVDVGAHLGNHTLWFAHVCRLNVVAFEPLAHAELQANLRLNPHLQDRVRLRSVGLGVDYGAARPMGKGVLEEDWDGPVIIVPLDSMELQDVSVMKIDVEGWEPHVLLGAAETIVRNRPVIYAEARDEDAAERNGQVLKQMRYERTGKVFGATPMEEWEPC